MEKDWKITFKTSLVFVYLLVSIALLIIPWDLWLNTTVSLNKANLGPSLASPFGFDNLGRDLLGRLSMSIRSNLPGIWLCSSLSVVLGWSLGTLLCVLERSSLKSVMIMMDWGLSLLSGIPIFIVVFGVAIVVGVMGSIPILVGLALVFIFSSCFQIRCLYKESCRLGYWESHRSIGGSIWDRVWKYGFCFDWKPHLLSYFCWALNISLICEVSLSYLGFGIQEPKPSLGNILAAHFSDYLHGNFRFLIAVVATLLLLTSIPYAVQSILQKRGKLLSQTEPNA